MSVTTRTNLATNPNAASITNYTYWAGTGGACTLTNLTTGGNTGPNFNRITFTKGTTAVSGGGIYDEPSVSLTAGAPVTLAYWVRPSITQSLTPQAQLYSGGTATGVVTGANVACPANVWTLLSVTITPAAGDNHAQLRAYALGGGAVVWPAGSTLDMDTVLFGDGGTYFDGSFVAAGSIVYAWTGAPNTSTSTATLYTPAITLAGYSSFDPCPRVGITLTDLVPSTCTLNVWRTADGDRTRVRSAEGISVTGSTFITDYEVPFGRPVQYDVEVLTGASAGVTVPSATVTVTPAAGCIQDPLVPNTAIALHGEANDAGEPFIRGTALKALEYNAGVSIIPILGVVKPVAILGPRQAAANVDFSLVTNAAQQNTTLRNLLLETPLLLVRGLPSWGDYLPGLIYTANAKAVEQPFDVAWGGYRTRWQIVGDSVASPRLDVLVPIWSYGDVQNLWATYQQAQDTFAAKTYLDALKSPTGV